MRSEYTELLAAIEGELLATLPERPDASWFARFFGELPGPPRKALARELNAPALELVRRGGKRWRPLVLALAAKSFGRADGALGLAAAVELAHSGTLIVDDIEDSSDERRGGPAIHLVYGVDAAVNAGNLLYFLPGALIDGLGAPEPVRLVLHARYALHMRRLHLGQAMDIQWHGAPAFFPDRASYLAMCALKTGVLARAAAELGALAAGAAGAEAGALGLAFEGAGVAFQILDDVRNLTTGNPGKRRGDDIVEGKKSLPAILACESDPGLAPRLAGLFEAARREGPQSPAVERAIGLISATGAVERASAEAARLLEDAAAAVSRACPPEAAPGAEASLARALLAGLVSELAG